MILHHSLLPSLPLSLFLSLSLSLLANPSLSHVKAKLGADIILPLDELLPFSVSDRLRERSLALTHRWQAREFAKKNSRNIHH